MIDEEEEDFSMRTGITGPRTEQHLDMVDEKERPLKFTRKLHWDPEFPSILEYRLKSKRHFLGIPYWSTIDFHVEIHEDDREDGKRNNTPEEVRNKMLNRTKTREPDDLTADGSDSGPTRNFVEGTLAVDRRGERRVLVGVDNMAEMFDQGGDLRMVHQSDLSLPDEPGVYEVLFEVEFTPRRKGSRITGYAPEVYLKDYKRIETKGDL